MINVEYDNGLSFKEGIFAVMCVVSAPFIFFGFIYVCKIAILLYFPHAFDLPLP